jgi:hypothetical protein
MSRFTINKMKGIIFVAAGAQHKYPSTLTFSIAIFKAILLRNSQQFIMKTNNLKKFIFIVQNTNN